MRAAPIWSMALVLAGALPAQAQTRSEVPIREVILDQGARLYSIPVQFGSTTIEVGLDTGSTGLRVQPATLAAGDAQDEGGSDTYGYTSGVRYLGEKAVGPLTLGGRTAALRFQDIKQMVCSSEMPNCPASRIRPQDIGVRGPSLTGGRFRAVLGIATTPAEIDSPLPALGIRRWIVSLPRPGDNAPGRLILDPGDDEVKDFVTLREVEGPLRGVRDAVTGCIVNTASKAKACAPLVLDSGAPGIRLQNIKLPRDAFPNASNAALALFEGDTLKATESFSAGKRDQAAPIRFDDNGRQPASVIFAGTLPYLAFDVLYDANARTIGLRARPPVPGGPVGAMVGQ